MPAKVLRSLHTLGARVPRNDPVRAHFPSKEIHLQVGQRQEEKQPAVFPDHGRLHRDANPSKDSSLSSAENLNVCSSTNEMVQLSCVFLIGNMLSLSKSLVTIEIESEPL